MTDEPVVLVPGDGGLAAVRVRLDLGYDGTDFSGWAAQPGRRTVQGTLEAALGTILHVATPPSLTVAGRTDAGVHARGQVAHTDLDPTTWQRWRDTLLRRLAGALPRDVRVHAVGQAPAGFDARFSPIERRYAYRICDTDGGPDPLRRHEILHHPRRLHVAAMTSASLPLVGEHDFAAFCRRREGATTVRELLELSWRRDPDGTIVAQVRADAFCHSMVRSLVGCMIAVGEGRKPVGWPAAVLAGGIRDSAVNVAKPHGLTLEGILFPHDDDLEARAAETRRLRAPRGS
ncbi:MAG: tRNA pseudouridine(38-40) synthase TruA [Candidatus Nanopelagicales bacterium]